VDRVAQIINAKSGDLNYLRIDAALTQAEAYIDQELSAQGETVPVTKNSVLTAIANDWAAGIVRGEDGNATEDQHNFENTFTDRAKKAFCRYLAINYNVSPCPFDEEAVAASGGAVPSTVEGPDPQFYTQPID
jgi:hypothetical protein